MVVGQVNITAVLDTTGVPDAQAVQRLCAQALAESTQRPAEAEHTALVALAGARHLGDDHLLAEALLCLGRCQFHSPHLDLALGHLSEAERLFVIEHDPLGRARCLNTMATVYSRSGLLPEALNLAEMALALYETHDDDEVASAYNSVGLIARGLGASGAALAALVEALAQSQQRQQWGIYGNAATNCGNIYMDWAKEYHATQPELSEHCLHRAELLFLQSLEAAARVDDLALLALVYGKLGQVHSRRGEYQQALWHFDVSLQKSRNTGHKYIQTIVLFMLSETLIAMNRLDDAEQQLHDAVATLEQFQQNVGLGSTLQLLSKTYEAKGDYRQALAVFHRFHDIEEQRYRRQHQLVLHASRLQLESERVRQENIMLSRQVQQDALTGLANRRALGQALQQHNHAVVVLIDADHFKHVNDRFSHGVGDQVLQWLARLLQQHCHEHDLASRYGGEEFALLWVNAQDPAGIHHRCEQLRRAVAEFAWDRLHPELRVTVSIGCALMREATSPEGAVRLADERLYQAKRRGRNQVVGMPTAMPGGFGDR
jgi:diguanylate cyclase (GGDEF)-like protein